MTAQEIEKAIQEWTNDQPAWVGHAIRDLGAGKSPVIGKLALMCVRAARGRVEVEKVKPDGMASVDASAGPVKLLSVGNVSGINKLKGDSALTFGETNMSVVYGLNGAGKSSFVRILKTVTGAADSHDLLADVYSGEALPQSCVVKYSIAGAAKTVQWAAGQDPAVDLRQVDIFDTSRGEVYFGENEVTYEPPVLTLFTKLIDVATSVAQKLEGWKKSAFALSAPPEVENTENYRRVIGAMGGEPFRQLLNAVTWTDGDGRKVEDLRLRLSEKTPEDRAKEMQKRKTWLEKLVAEIRTRQSGLSDAQYQKIVDARKNATVKREAADLAAKELFSSSAKLEGVGSAVWRELWMAAKQYATAKAYPGKEYPGKDEGVRCVLCHQELGAEARKRMESFENYVKGTAQKESDAAQLAVKTLQDGIPAEFKDEDLQQRLDAAGISDAEERKRLVAFNASVRDRRLAFLQDAVDSPLPALEDMSDWLSVATEKAKKLEDSVQSLLADAQSGEAGRKKIQGELAELLAKKWIFENRKNLGRIHVHKRLNADLDAAKKLTATARISTKKSELAEAVVTEAYAARFKKELNELSGGRIKVTLAKSRVARGRVLHRIGLMSAKKVELKSVLSEGESRIVSLAAFLADSEGNRTTSPFVFDDPISSLDQNYEEAVARRLLDLSKKRQVVVFTHRLSMVGAIDHYRDEGYEVSYSAIREIGGATGVPTGFFMSEKSIKSALSTLLQDRITACKRMAEEGRAGDYETTLKGMCSDFRVLIERSVESDLLCGVVKRYTRPVYTMKIPHLAKLQEKDWKLLHELMTKFSGFEHSQPLEAPVPLPDLSDFKSDVERLIAWRKEYKDRT